MKTTDSLNSGIMACALVLLLDLAAHAQQYTIPWFTIDGGGGTSTSAVFSVSGTIGQADARVHTGGTYSLVGGFWGVVSVIQTPGAPLLSVTNSGGPVVIFWSKPADDFVLDQTTALANSPELTIWSEVPAATYQTNATHIFLTVPTPAGNKVYRLRKP